MRRARILCSVLLVCLASGLGVVPGWLDGALAMEESDRLWMVGEQALSDGLYPLSRRMLERLIDRYPADRRIPDATLLLGKARFSQKAFPARPRSLQEGAEPLTPAPGRPGEARFWEAETLFRMERYAEARDAYDRVVAEDPRLTLRSATRSTAARGATVSSSGAIWPSPTSASFSPTIRTPDRAPPRRFYLARTLVEIEARRRGGRSLLQSFADQVPRASAPAGRLAMARAGAARLGTTARTGWPSCAPSSPPIPITSWPLRRVAWWRTPCCARVARPTWPRSTSG